jgi:hypothetical protein
LIVLTRETKRSSGPIESAQRHDKIRFVAEQNDNGKLGSEIECSRHEIMDLQGRVAQLVKRRENQEPADHQKKINQLQEQIDSIQQERSKSAQ